MRLHKRNMIVLHMAMERIICVVTVIEILFRAGYHHVKINAENKNILRRNTLLKKYCRDSNDYCFGSRVPFVAGENDIALLFFFLFQDGCSLVNGSPTNQQKQQQPQQLTLILLFGNHCRMGQSAQVKKDC